LRDRSAFIKADSWSNYYNGAIFGILLIMIFYNFFVYVSLRDRGYLYYTFFIAALTAWQFAYQGYAYRILWPNNPWLANIAIPVFVCACLLTHAVFSRTYLDTARLVPRIDIILKAGIVLWASILAYAFVGSYKIEFLLIIPTMVTSSIGWFAVGILCMRRGQRPARFYNLSFAVLIVGGCLVALKAGGIVPSNFITENGIMIGFVFAVLLLALGLADRINVIRAEHQAAQQAALEKETEARQAQEKVSADLKRMDQLKDAFLANTSHELRTPLAGIIGLADALIQGVGRDDATKINRNLQLIVHSARRLSNLVNDILDFERLRKADITLQLQPSDL
ncbi:MAG: hypothetical protein KDK34_03610, partial [Leptospiraceae bacterium]|nr:hypothetical protein [Leptospiraceae bacterium]